MIVFKTERLIIKTLEVVDKNHFAELLTDEQILKDIPQKAFTERQITDRFNKNLNLDLSDLNTRKCVCGIFEKGHQELIGLALFLINENNEKELGYRFRVPYWEKGYGTETTKGMLDYYFNVLKTDKVTADANIANVASIAILTKFMKPVKDFFNERDNCTDRRFEIKKDSTLNAI